MIWREDDKRDEQQKKLEYARELEQQIELRKALEREEKQQQEEWERQFVVPKDEQSPAKWWTELRAADGPANRFGFHMDASAMPYADVLAEQGAQSSSNTNASASLQRFGALGDPLASTDRLREKAQQLEWKRILDEQVREKERRQQQEAEEKRRREYEEAQEEMRFLRERQLRAQRKLGIVGSTPTAGFTPQNYLAIPSPPAPPKDRHHHAAEARRYSEYNGFPIRDLEDHHAVPAPAPVHARVNDSVDYNFRHAMGLSDAVAAPPQQEQSSRDHIVDEYRALLVEIRREREELRRERDELRREKEELRMERALMQMENEKMATLLESQRQMNEQRMETVERLDRVLETRASNVGRASPQSAHQQQMPRPSRPLSPLHVVHRDHSVQQLRQSIASLAVAHRGNQSPANRFGAMSMADFAPAMNLRSPPNGVDSPRVRRLQRFRQREENPLERSLNGESEFIALSPHSARGRDADVATPRIMETNSPAASRMDPRNAARVHENALRSSRVIKSRGYYDFNRDDALPQRSETRSLDGGYSPLQTQRSPARRAPGAREFRQDAASEGDYSDGDRLTGLGRHHSASLDLELAGDGAYDRDDGDDEFADEAYADDARSQRRRGSDFGSDSELSRSLFQVKVLVKE